MMKQSPNPLSVSVTFTEGGADSEELIRRLFVRFVREAFNSARKG